MLSGCTRNEAKQHNFRLIPGLLVFEWVCITAAGWQGIIGPSAPHAHVAAALGSSAPLVLHRDR